MRHIVAGLCLCFMFSTQLSHAQGQYQIKPDLVVKGKLLGTSKALRDIKHTRLTRADKGKKKVKEIPNFESRQNKFPIEYNPNPQVDPLWKNGQVMTRTKAPQTSTVLNIDGTTFTGVNPPDPTVDVDSNHVVQMVNGSSGTMMRIWDKTGTLVYGPTTLNNFWSSFGVSGLGDPIAMYDNMANRWFISEFSATGNFLLIAISQTSDPTGQYDAYQFNTPNFPDYPKYSVWPNAYYCTTNEGGDRTIYAIDRNAMLNGTTPTMQRFTTPNLFGFGFQALTPVDFDGVTAPNSLTKATFWRHIDDEAHNPGSNNPNGDLVEYWELSPNFTTPANSLLSGPTQLNVSEFDSDINGYFSFSGITQPGNVSLDPLREVFMNKMQYINFGTHESIVGCHVTDVTGQDQAGIRWYEFRNSPTGWTLYQEGTYSPTSENRWMSSISQDLAGNIAIAYSVASSTVYPSLRYTGRAAGDPLGQMTLQEQTIVNGSASNSSQRYGDYADMSLDPANNSTFWFTGEYNANSTWSTRVVGFNLNDTCNALNATGIQSGTLDCADDTTASITLTASGGNASNYTFSIDGVTFQSSNVFSGLGQGNYTFVINDGTGCSVLTAPIAVNGPMAINASYTEKDISCHGETDGSILVSSFGGTGNIELSLNNGPFGLTNFFDNLPAGNYTVYLKDLNDCRDTSAVMVITEPPVLTASETISPETFNNSADGEIQIHATGGTPAYIYALNDTNAYQNDSVFNNLSEGVYTYYVKDANGCTVQTQLEVLLSSIKDINGTTSYEVYPNPTNGNFQLNITGIGSNASLEINLVDALGKVVDTKKVTPSSAELRLDYSLSHLANGIYFLNINNNNSVSTIKILHQ